MTDQELQALVLATGLMPCDRLPKKDPDQELKNFLIRVAVNINGAAKEGKADVSFGTHNVPGPVEKRLMKEAKPVLEQLGYKVGIFSYETIQGTCMVLATSMTISGWSD